jgi:hypothetical protein
MEEIIKKLQEEEGYNGTDEGIACARVSEQEAVKDAVKEAMEEGLLQPHGIPPNLKQDCMFRILCVKTLGGFRRRDGDDSIWRVYRIYFKDGQRSVWPGAMVLYAMWKK